MEKILIVDDDLDFQFTISNVLKEEKYEVAVVDNGKRAIKTVQKDPPDIVLLDIRLHDKNGIKVLEKIKKIDKNLIVIMITGYGGVEEAVRSMKLGAVDYITKPFDNRDLVHRIQKALQTKYLTKEVDFLRKILKEKVIEEEMMGRSQQIRRVLSQLKVVAPTDMTIIIQGKSGTGKELIAHLIHQQSNRANGPFVAIDCNAIPVSLAESELFGYERGAFTGSENRKEGRFEQANGGTLFLDEITNLSDEIQAKLLRVIQERKLQHLGGKKDIKIDVRIIVATNADLSRGVKSGKFRSDLYYRLNEFCISLPSLEDRKEDLPVLSKYFLKEANKEFQKNIKGFSPEVLRLMLNYSWPGNIRELRNFVRQAALWTESEIVTSVNLPANIKVEEECTNTSLADGTSFKERVQHFEKELIQRALEVTGNNKVRTARLLKIHRKALYRKIKSLGL